MPKLHRDTQFYFSYYGASGEGDVVFRLFRDSHLWEKTIPLPYPKNDHFWERSAASVAGKVAEIAQRHDAPAWAFA